MEPKHLYHQNRQHNIMYEDNNIYLFISTGIIYPKPLKAKPFVGVHKGLFKRHIHHIIASILLEFICRTIANNRTFVSLKKKSSNTHNVKRCASLFV